MSFHHRMPAFVAAFLSSCAVILAAFAGVSCEFLLITQTTETQTTTTTTLSSPSSNNNNDNSLIQASSMGITCDPFNLNAEVNDDHMWELSRIFWIIGLTLGSITAALAWAVCTYMTPTIMSWKGISVIAALTAVLQVPIFIIFESQPCSDGQCKLGTGSYFLIASDLLLITVCIITQCWDPPKWAMELELWKVNPTGQQTRKSVVSTAMSKKKQKHGHYDSDDDEIHLRQTSEEIDDDDDEHDNDMYHITRILPASKTYKDEKDLEQQEVRVRTQGNNNVRDDIGISGFFTRIFGSTKEKISKRSIDLEIPGIETESTKDQDEYDYENQMCDDSQLIVKVLPDDEEEMSKKKNNKNYQIKSKGTDADDSTQKNSSITLELPNSLFKNHKSNALAKALVSNEVERHLDLDTSQPSLPQADTLSSDAILADLQINESEKVTTDGSPNKPRNEFLYADEYHGDSNDQEQLLNAKGGACMPSDNIISGVRKLTQKLKRNSTKPSRKSGRRRQKVRNGYAQMLDDVDYDSDEGLRDVNSPPLEVKVPYAETAEQTLLEKKDVEDADGNTSRDDAGGIQLQMLDLSDDEDIYLENESWIDLTNGNDNSFVTDESDGSYHSDPEPAIYDGEDAEYRSEQKTATSGSNNLSLEDDEVASGSKGRTPSRSDDVSRGRRRKRANSPVESIKSHRSLLRTTINEETEEDIEEELSSAYSLSRTLSAPEPRSLTYDKSTLDILKKNNNLDLLKSLDIETSSYDEELLSSRKERIGETVDSMQRENRAITQAVEHPVLESEVGDIPMMPKVNTSQEGDSISKASPSSNVHTGPENENDAIAMASETLRISQATSSIIKHTWKEPDLPTKKAWKKTDTENAETKKDTSLSSVSSWKDPALPSRKGAWKNSLTSNLNLSDETSDTDDTGCLSRTTDSFSDDSYESGNEAGPRRIVVRSKSLGRVARRQKQKRNSKSLSPSRSSKIHSFLSKNENNSSFGRAREIRIRRLRRLKGYVPLEEKQTMSLDRSSLDNENLTPKRKTILLSSDEKKEDDVLSDRNVLANSPMGLPDDLYQPNLLLENEASSNDFPLKPRVVPVGQSEAPSNKTIEIKESISPVGHAPSNLTEIGHLHAESFDDDLYIEDSKTATDFSESHDYDSMLDELDLQLIGLRRPVGAEYGDDERSL